MGLVFNYKYQLYTSVRLKMYMWFCWLYPKKEITELQEVSMEGVKMTKSD